VENTIQPKAESFKSKTSYLEPRTLNLEPRTVRVSELENTLLPGEKVPEGRMRGLTAIKTPNIDFAVPVLYAEYAIAIIHDSAKAY